MRPTGNMGDLRKSLHRRALELFSLCDVQGKGYASKAELAALRTELPLSPQQLDQVFDALDRDGNGRLTLEEFTDGFGMFLGIEGCDGSPETAEDTDDDEIFEELLDHLGARNLFGDEDYVRDMWRRVQKQDPVMLSNFENFVAKMAADLKESVEEQSKLQSTLKSRSQDHEAQVQSLYAEMEEQMRTERELLLAKERQNEQKIRDELEEELDLKDQQLQMLLKKHSEMKNQLQNLNLEEAETRHEKVKLEKDRDVLEYRLVASDRMVQEMKEHVQLLRQRSLDERRKRAQAALKVSESIALERENLVNELNHLKEVNKQLLDEKDELCLSAVQVAPAQITAPSNQRKSKKHRLRKEKTFVCLDPDTPQMPLMPDVSHGRMSYSSDRSFELTTHSHPLLCIPEVDSCPESHSESCTPLPRSSDDECEVDDLFFGQDVQNNLNRPASRLKTSSTTKNDRPLNRTTEDSTVNCPSQASTSENNDDDLLPTRVFKVVFVGDSGVGKTSFLHRFCNDTFRPTFSATIGVDFQVKTVEVEGEKMALQLWDTAGQERFRSLTQQYFRKADGIIVVYDVTAETSFRNARNWIHNIQEGVAEGTVILLVGNKIDLCATDQDRVIKTKDGARLADEFGALFYETSAKAGSSVRESIEALASLLRLKENETMERILTLQEARRKQKRLCC